MNRLLFLIAFSFLFQFNSNAQEAINNYKYIIIDNQYDFQKSEDQYQLNSLTKFLFNKYGYEAYLQNDEFPTDLGANNCLGLKAVLKDIKGGFLVTKVQIDLVDCKNNVIASSVIGRTKIKEYKKAYNRALRDAFATYQNFDYKYNGNAGKETSMTSQPVVEVKETEKVPEEAIDVRKKEEVKEVVKDAVEPEVETVEEQAVVTPSAANKKEILYAQPIDNGFQIVDTEPKKVMILLYSGSPDMYIVQGKDAVVYRSNGAWVYAENNGEGLQVKKINLKF
ncbi:hypothetical protein [uncultured Psychroserpens sp.]|uniref:hypothetical protein n=1 Tax=uncultured Psychroserpens sp. TaxID=255436 RepID=UPI00262926A9|nr:hypothetical protein [uncultured Psychroserpens sp.]